MINFAILNEDVPDANASYIPLVTTNIECYEHTNVDVIANATKGGDVFFVTNGEFSLHELVRNLVKIEGRLLSMTLSTFSFTEVPVRTIGELFNEGLLSNLAILVDERARANYPGIFTQLKMFTPYIAIAPVHAKVTVLEFENKWLTITGSANWTTNKRFEVGSIYNNSSMALFNKNWINQAINERIHDKRTMD